MCRTILQQPAVAVDPWTVYRDHRNAGYQQWIFRSPVHLLDRVRCPLHHGLDFGVGLGYAFASGLAARLFSFPNLYDYIAMLVFWNYAGVALK
jgi:hypothetical protein